MQCGSSGYIAPEVLNKRGYNCQSDIFGAGVIFYIILTGRSLFKGKTLEEILMLNRRNQYQFNDHQWKNVSPEAKDLVKKLLIEDPDQRITASDAL